MIVKGIIVMRPIRYSVAQAMMSMDRLLNVYVLHLYLSRYDGDLKCGFLVLATKEKSKCISLDNVLKHSHLKGHRVDRHDSDDDDVEVLV